MIVTSVLMPHRGREDLLFTTFAVALARLPARLRVFVLLGLLMSGVSALALPAYAQQALVVQACGPALNEAERVGSIPPMLLQAVALGESGRRDPVTGQVLPWPWTINAEGKGYFFPTKAEAVAAVAAFQRLGTMSVDVGCLQVNLLHHPDAFSSLEEAFDPVVNVTYGARFLGRLYNETGAWPKAIAAYHSRTPSLGNAYAQRVLALWSPASSTKLQLTEALGNRTQVFETRLAQDAKDHAARLADMRFRSELATTDVVSAEGVNFRRVRRERL